MQTGNSEQGVRRVCQGLLRRSLVVDCLWRVREPVSQLLPTVAVAGQRCCCCCGYRGPLHHMRDTCHESDIRHVRCSFTLQNAAPVHRSPALRMTATVEHDTRLFSVCASSLDRVCTGVCASSLDRVYTGIELALAPGRLVQSGMCESGCDMYGIMRE